MKKPKTTSTITLATLWLCLAITSLKCAEPTNDSNTNSIKNTIDDIILKRCPLLVTYNQTLLEHVKTAEPVFNQCTDVEGILSLNNVSQLSSNNINNIRCLLYLESLSSLCKNVPEPSLETYDTIFEKDIKEVGVCKNVTLLLPPGKNNISNIIETCGAYHYVCFEYDHGSLQMNSLCKKAYHFNTIKLSVKANSSKVVETTNIEKIPANSDKHSNTNHLQPTLIDIIKPPVPEQHDDKKQPEEKKSQEPPNQEASNQLDIETKKQPPKEPNVEAVEKNQVPLNKVPDFVVIKEPNTSKKTEDVVEIDSPNEGLANEQNPIETADPADYANVDAQNKDTFETDVVNNVVNGQEDAPPKLDVQNNASNLPKYAPPKAVKEPYEYEPDGDLNGNSNFFVYFSFVCVVFVLAYIGYHNKQKLLAIIVEGRYTRRPQRSGGRRPNSANYHKLDSNLEEAISSSCNKNTTHIIY